MKAKEIRETRRPSFAFQRRTRYEADSVQVGCPSYLDLKFYLDSAGAMQYKTHRKELNSYDYLPRTSAHPPAVWQGIVA